MPVPAVPSALLETTILAGVLVALTLLCAAADLDFRLERRFYDARTGVFPDSWLWHQLYRFGALPAVVLALGALALLVLSYFVRRLRPFKRSALFFVLLVLIGPTLLVNIVLKEHWGRPRPSETVAFSGKEHYREAWQAHVGGRGRSFPSGHASMGFYLLAPFFVLRRRWRRWALVFLALGIGHGMLLGLARMIQGRHYLTDVLWSGGIVYACGCMLSMLLGLDRAPTAASGAGPAPDR